MQKEKQAARPISSWQNLSYCCKYEINPSPTSHISNVLSNKSRIYKLLLFMNSISIHAKVLMYGDQSYDYLQQIHFIRWYRNMAWIFFHIF
jgi:hypothetical protein